MKKSHITLILIAFLTFNAHPGQAHFIELIPDQNIMKGTSSASVTLNSVFSHPFEGGPLMRYEKPKSIGVQFMGKKHSLLDQIKAVKDHQDLEWQLSYEPKRSGDYIFYVEPQPYFEPAEEKFIIHYTKTIVHKSMENGWDDLVGFPVEIQALTRPYGIWTHNLFRGVVLHNGKPVPFAPIEVEYKNTDAVVAPSDAFITQTILSDENGVFAYALPKAGWWGFAALIEDSETKTAPDGQDYPIEKGGLLWINAQDMR